MPVLQWVGKDKVVNHHYDVPFRLLKKQYSFQAKDGSPKNSTNNRIIHGDNLEALKSLLPEFEGKINCIYIDPPYNTGNEGWVYNDNVNDPKIKKWLGEVVGKEGEDLSRHDKWLCMMYPRLKLLHRLLADDGAIFISIDDNEQANLKLVMDEVFGIGNFFANFVVQSKDTPGNNSTGVAMTHNHLLCYKKGNNFKPNLLKRSEKQIANYKNPDSDPRGVWLAAPLTRSEFRERDYYSLTNPKGVEVFPPPATCWRRPKEVLQKLILENRVWWGKNGDSTFPMEKKFLSEAKEGVVFQTFWPYDFSGSTRNANSEIKGIFSGNKLFDTPKPILLLERVLELASAPDSIVLDSFSGSGTTAHAVLKLNAEDGGNRRFICIEMMDYAETITAERVRRVIDGYGEENKTVAGLGGGFDFYTVDAPLFLEGNNLNEAVGVEAIRNYVAYTERLEDAQRAIVDNTINPYGLGLKDNALYVFYYERDRITTLDMSFLGELPIKQLSKRPEQYIIYADRCTLEKNFMLKHGITFKRIPRDISRF